MFVQQLPGALRQSHDESVPSSVDLEFNDLLDFADPMDLGLDLIHQGHGLHDNKDIIHMKCHDRRLVACELNEDVFVRGSSHGAHFLHLIKPLIPNIGGLFETMKAVPFIRVVTENAI